LVNPFKQNKFTVKKKKFIRYSPLSHTASALSLS
jgi:hypothetical protein